MLLLPFFFCSMIRYSSYQNIFCSMIGMCSGSHYLSPGCGSPPLSLSLKIFFCFVLGFQCNGPWPLEFATLDIIYSYALLILGLLSLTHFTCILTEFVLLFTCCTILCFLMDFVSSIWTFVAGFVFVTIVSYLYNKTYFLKLQDDR